MNAFLMLQCTCWTAASGSGAASTSERFSANATWTADGILAVDVGEPVGVKAPPQPIVRAAQPLLRGGQPLGQLGIVTEALHELCGELARRVGDREAHRAPAFRAARPVARGR